MTNSFTTPSSILPLARVQGQIPSLAKELKSKFKIRAMNRIKIVSFAFAKNIAHKKWGQNLPENICIMAAAAPLKLVSGGTPHHQIAETKNSSVDFLTGLDKNSRISAP